MKRIIACAAVAAAGIAFAQETMSPFDDAVYYFHGGVDANANGILDHGTSEFRDITQAGVASSPHHVSKYLTTASPYGKVLAKTGRVYTPLAGTYADNVPYMHIDQPFVTNGTVEIDGVTYPTGRLYSNYLWLPNLFSDLPAGVSCTNYTLFIRFREESKVSEVQIEHQLAALGYHWGERKGIAVSIYTGGKAGNLWYPKIYLGQTQFSVSGDDCKFSPGHWCDLAVSVAGKKATVAICPNISESPLSNQVFVAWSTAVSADNLAVVSDRRWVRVGGEEAGETVVYTNGVNGSHNQSGIVNKAKAFRGDVQTIAFWRRSLSTSEIRQVMSERRPAIVRAGFANGSADEFTGETDTFDQQGLAPETWNPALNADHPTKTIKFAVVDGEQDVSQYLRIRPTADSAAAEAVVALDGAFVRKVALTAGRDTLVYFKKNLMTQGSHALTITRTDEGGGTCTIDALSLSGSWRIGRALKPDDEYGGMEHESNYPYQYNRWVSPRLYNVEDGNMNHFARGLSAGSNCKHTYSFNLPADILPGLRDSTFTLRTGTSGLASNSYAFTLNDVALTNITVNGSYVDVSFSVPARCLKAGENTLSIERPSDNWANIRGYLFSLGRPASEGTVLILR